MQDRRQALVRPAGMVIAAGIVMALSSVLPWGTTIAGRCTPDPPGCWQYETALTGLEMGWGAVVFGIGVVLLLTGVWLVAGRAADEEHDLWLVISLTGVVAALIALYVYLHEQDDVRFGLGLLLVATVLAVAGGLSGMRDRTS